MSITFSTIAIPPFWDKETLLLAESLRQFGGHFAREPVTVLIRPENPLAPEAKTQLEALGVTLVEFEMDEEAKKFPLAVVPYGAAAAEEQAQGSTDLMAWILPDTLILNEPIHFTLPSNSQVGYRPVHHQNIGSSYGQPVEPFWQLIYDHCQVEDERIFQMDTCCRESVRPYFNAGLLVTRPEAGVMRGWLETFQRTYNHPDFTPFYEEHKYAIFMHQAVLAGVLLSKYSQTQLLELPESCNYPLHMHTDYPQTARIKTLAELTTARYENTRELPEYLAGFDCERKQWITNKIGTLMEKNEQP